MNYHLEDLMTRAKIQQVHAVTAVETMTSAWIGVKIGLAFVVTIIGGCAAGKYL